MIEVATLMMVTYNRLELTKKTIDNIIENTGRPFNLVIIDNDSKDDTPEFLRDLMLRHEMERQGLMKELVVVFNDKNKGIAIGRNQGLVEANKLDTTWFSTVDNDVLLPKGWLSDCIDILKENKTYGMIGVNFEARSFPIVKSGKFEFQDKARGNLGTACTVFNRTFHKMVGFFNTEYGLYGEEDADMGARARAVGFKIGYLKENGVHLGEGEADQGEYREFKTKSHQDNLKQFQQNAASYFRNQRSPYIPCKVS